MPKECFCCRNSSDARKAMITSSAALLLTTLMLFVGAGLFAYYEPIRLAGNEPVIFSEDSNYIFPVWIVTELPVGLRGLILAGILPQQFPVLIQYWQHFHRLHSLFSEKKIRMKIR